MSLRTAHAIRQFKENLLADHVSQDNIRLIVASVIAEGYSKGLALPETRVSNFNSWYDYGHGKQVNHMLDKLVEEVVIDVDRVAYFTRCYVRARYELFFGLVAISSVCLTESRNRLLPGEVVTALLALDDSILNGYYINVINEIADTKPQD